VDSNFGEGPSTPVNWPDFDSYEMAADFNKNNDLELGSPLKMMNIHLSASSHHIIKQSLFPERFYTALPGVLYFSPSPYFMLSHI